jgi:membrane protease subunit HflC
MSRIALTLSLIVLAAAAAAYLTLFTVSQTQQALLLEFGKPKRVITEPGLQYKIPFIQNVVYFSKRILDIDTASQEVIASDQKRLVVDAFARYRIVDPLLFFQSVANEEGANSRLGAVLESSLRRVLGAASFATVVRDKREELMRTILSQVNKEAEPFGINVVDVRIKRVDLPEANMQAIYRRMQTERQRQAAEFRAEGEGASRRIRGTADRQVTVIKADATGESERIRGAGDAEKNRIFADAFGQDPDFFAFYRSMQAYEGALKAGDTRLLLSPDSQFFRYFNDAFGKTGQMGTGQPAAEPSNPAEKLSAPADDGDGDTLQQGAGGEGAPSPEHDISVGGGLPPAPQAR